MSIDVYPVGVLEAWQHRRIPGKLRQCRRYLIHQLRQRNWRAIRNSFGGYHAELNYPWPAERCGTGWTRRRAIADLARHLAGEDR